jgi:hypothetical protein
VPRHFRCCGLASFSLQDLQRALSAAQDPTLARQVRVDMCLGDALLTVLDLLTQCPRSILLSPLDVSFNSYLFCESRSLLIWATLNGVGAGATSASVCVLCPAKSYSRTAGHFCYSVGLLTFRS